MLFTRTTRSQQNKLLVADKVSSPSTDVRLGASRVGCIPQCQGCISAVWLQPPGYCGSLGRRRRARLHCCHPIVRNLEETHQMCHSYDAVITAGVSCVEVAHWHHPNHYIGTLFDDFTDPLDPLAPTEVQIRTLLQWAKTQSGTMLIHCHAGISRSTACAWGVMIGRGTDPSVAIQALFDAHPEEVFLNYYGKYKRRFQPNLLIVQHLETIFARYDLYNILEEKGFLCPDSGC